MSRSADVKTGERQPTPGRLVAFLTVPLCGNQVDMGKGSAKENQTEACPPRAGVGARARSKARRRVTCSASRSTT